MSQQPGNPLLLFCSYAPEDERLHDKLAKHLILLQHNGLITMRDYRDVKPGADKTHVIHQYLKDSAVILLLISPDYLASASCYIDEMSQALERHRKGEALVIPVLLRPVDLDATPLAHLQYVPRNSKPVALWDQQDVVLREIAQELRSLIESRRYLNGESTETNPEKEVLNLPKLLSMHVGGHDNNTWLVDHPERDLGKFKDEAAQVRQTYLATIQQHYYAVTLPLGSQVDFSLHAIFQPLKLRQSPLAAEDLLREQRRLPLLNEEGNDPYRQKSPVPPIIAEHSEDALVKSPHQRLVILGGPGSGKTITLKHLLTRQAQLCRDDLQAPIPIFLSLAAFARSGKTFQQYLWDIAEDMGVSSSFKNLLWEAVRQGHAFVCLDSLDEVAPNHRSSMIDLINTYTAEEGNVWIIGSRFTEYKGGQFTRGRFAEWELLALTHELRMELARRLLPELQRHLSPLVAIASTPEIFVQKIEHHPHIARWGENPLLFSLAAVAYTQTGDLPTSRAALYSNVIETVLAMREPDPFAREILLQDISEFALWLHQIKGRTFTQQDMLTFWRERRPQSFDEEIARKARKMIECGLFDIVAYKTYGFRHLSFQEYLAATELVRNFVGYDQEKHRQAWTLAWSKRTYSRWTEILRLMVGELMQAPKSIGKQYALRWFEHLLNQRNQSDGDIGDLGLTLAIQSLGEIAMEDQAMIQLQQRIVILWFETYSDRYFLAFDDDFDPLRGREHRLLSLLPDALQISQHTKQVLWNHLMKRLENPERRKQVPVITLLSHLGKYLPAEWFFTLLSHANINVQCASIKALGETDDYACINALITASHDKHLEVRQTAVEALGKQGEHVSLDVLLSALQDKNSQVRRTAVEALGKQGERVSLDVLLSALQDEDEWVRMTAVEVLGKQGTRVPLDTFLSVIQNEARIVRSAGVQALGKQGERVPLDILLSALHDKDSEIRRTAVFVLGDLGEQVPLAVFLSALQDEDLMVRVAAMYVMGRLGERVPLDIFLSALQDEEPFMQRAALEGLGKQGTRIPPETFSSILQDKRTHIINASIQVLSELDECVPLDAFLSAIEDRDPVMRDAVVQVLDKQDEQVIHNFLFAALHDKRLNVRWYTGYALNDLGECVPLSMLLSILQHEDWFIRKAAIQALSKKGYQVPLDIFLSALQDENREVREAALEALGKQGERAPLDVLLSALQSEDRAMRCTAVKALGELGEYAPLDILLSALQDESIEVQKAAIFALGNLGERVPLDILLSALQSKDGAMRCAAVKALGELGEHAPLDVLLSLLQDEDFVVRMVAGQALGNLGEHVPLNVLLSALQNEDFMIRSAARNALSKQGERVPLGILLSALQDEDQSARCAALEGLSKRIADFSLDILQPFLQDEVGDVRSAVISILGKQAEFLSPDILLLVLHDKDAWVRMATLQVFGERLSFLLLELLLDAARDKSSYVRPEALALLHKYYPERFALIVEEARLILQGQADGSFFHPLRDMYLADVIGTLGLSTPIILQQLTKLLNAPHWQTRYNAIQAFKRIRRSIPDEALQQLLAIRTDDPIRAVRDIADTTLADILTLETSIEDD